MKKNILITLVSLLIMNTSLNAQGMKKRSEKIKLLKIGFLTEKLKLTEQEAEKFWSVYNTYNTQLNQLDTNERTIFKTVKDFDETSKMVSENNSKNKIDKILTIKQQKQKVYQEMLSKLTPIIGHRKVLTMLVSEREFNRKLIRRLRKNQKN